MRQFPGQHILLVLETELRGQRIGLLIEQPMPVDIGPEMITMAMMRLHGQGQVLQDGHFVEHRGHLERAGYPHSGPFIHRQRGNVVTIEKDPAAARLQFARQLGDGSGFAGTIGTDQGMDLTAQ